MTTESATETQVAPETSSSPPAKTETPAERRARHAAAIDKKTPAQPAETAPAAKPDDAPPAPSVAADQSRKDKILATLKAQQQARQERQGRETAAQEQQRIAAENAQLKAQIEQFRNQPNLDQFFADYDKDPAATLRKFKRDPKAALELLTRDALAPGIVRGNADTEELRNEVKRLRDEREADRRQQEQERLAQQQAQAYEAENKAWTQHVAVNKERWPLMAALDNDDLLDEAIWEWQRLKAQGAEYDRDLVADSLEERLSRRHAKWQQSAKPSPSPTANTARPQAAASKKAPAKTLTPELATESGAPKRKTWAERKQEHIDRIDRGE